MRLGEALALRWDGVDLAAGIAVVRHAFWRGRLQVAGANRAAVDRLDD